MAPIIHKVAVLGATGQQGGAVVDALSERGVEVVGITRNPDSDKAKALATKPRVTVKQADLNDVESLKAAFEGCDGAFVVANFWEGMNVDVEVEHYRNAAAALRATPSIQLVILSTLEESVVPGATDDFKVLHEHKEMGKMYVPHFDGKNRSEQFFEGLPVTFMVTSCFFENFTSFFTSTKNKDGSYTFTLPLSKDKQIPWTILPDLGALAAGAFLKPETTIGTRIGQASFYATGDELAEILSKVTGKTITYHCVPWDTFAAFGFPAADELAQMFELWLRIHEDFCALRRIPPQEELMGRKVSDPVEYGKTFADKILFQET
jgi:uncharacterized protein YbjT (DUF2867 family)